MIFFLLQFFERTDTACGRQNEPITTYGMTQRLQEGDVEPLQLNVEGAKTILARLVKKTVPANESAANWTKTVLAQRTTCDL